MISQLRIMWNELWKYRHLIRQLAMRDLKTRYKVSILGFFWSLLRPLLTLMILATVFSLLDFESSSYKVSYYVLLLASYMPWFYFSTALLEGTQSMLSNAHLVKKEFCPRSVFPTSVVLANLINFLFSLLVIFPVLYLATPAYPTWTLLQLPLVILVSTLFLLGLCLITSAVNVIYRDTTQLIEFLAFVWFYISPVLYDVYEVFAKIPSSSRWVYFVNPMAGIIEWYRYVFLASHHRSHQPSPEQVKDFPLLDDMMTTVFQKAIPYSIIMSFIILFLGYWIFKKYETRAVDEM